MSEEIKDNARRTVTSIGNSWIVCKSKSHPGHVYYFNSLTGEAAWNLSDAEIEKAKRRTKHLECIPGAVTTRCPEPKENPPSAPSNNLKPMLLPFNGPFIINRTLQQQQLSDLNLANPNATLCTSLNQISQVMQNTQINNPSPVYNPKVWDIPQTHPLFMTPTMTPILNQNQGSLSVAYNNLSHIVSQPWSGFYLNSCDNASRPGQTKTGGTQPFYPQEFNYGQGVEQNINKTVVYPNKIDLRQKLCSKKKNYNILSGIPGGSGIRINSRKSDDAAHITTTHIEGIHSNVLPDESKGKDNEYEENMSTKESRCIDTQIHETSSKIDLTPLKNLASSNCNTDVWFIVVDLDVLLKEFKFLTVLTDSDEKCHLMVPRRVMEELISYVTCTKNIQAKRILRFLSQQIEIGYSYMADEPSHVEGDSMAEILLTTCTELSDNNYHLVLVTSDKKLLTKKSLHINVFSIDDIKKLLDNPNKQPVLSGQKKQFLIDGLINKIKITVPNNTSENINTSSPVKSNEIDDHTADNPITQPKQNNIQDKTEEIVIMKHTVDAGIQTDIEDINACINRTNVLEEKDPNAEPKNPQNTNEMFVSSVAAENIPNKKKEIKLNRSTSNQSSVRSTESEKRQFKWRRRRNPNIELKEQIPAHNDGNTNPKEVESLQTNTSPQINTVISKQSDKIPNNNPGNIENNILDNNIESQESSIYADLRNSTSKENVTIEETSTSGIISNTESNIDAESNCSYSTINQPQFLYYGQSHSKPMYEVDSVVMKKYLRMKCDEWTSRFVQIMEEVLSQVLQEAPSFSHKDMPPPWTLQEAAVCVAIKFGNNQEIKSAANNLSSFLFRISDTKGRLSMNITPNQYMQMYSYGVHLLTAMKETTSSEDIQIAMESLNKLLHDIRNPNMDASTNDTFNDNLHDNMSINDTSLYSDMPNNCDVSSLHEQEMLPDCNEPKKRKLSETELHKPVKFIRNISVKPSFIKSLSFKTSNIVNNSESQMSNSVKSQVQSQEQQHSINPPIGEKNNSENDETAKKGTDVATYHCNIIRKFVICSELEKKIKSNNNFNVYENHDEDLDYNEDYGEYITEEYCSEDENYEVQQNACAVQNAKVNKTNVSENTNQKTERKIPEVVDSLVTKDSKKFKYMMSMLLQEIKEALCQVRILCDKCYTELRNPDRSTEKRQLRKIAERAHLHTVRLCRSLESMLDHETNNPSQSMCNLLKQADVNITQVDPKLMFKYRIAVAKCRQHADKFLSSIQNIILELNSVS